MAEAIITIEGIETKASKPGADRAWVRHSVNGGGHYYSWFEGQVDGLDERLLKPGVTVKITYEQKDKYRNITGAEAAEMPIKATVPFDTSVTHISANGQKYTDADRAAFARKDEMYARQTACNCAAQMDAAYIQMGERLDFWKEVSQIEHYILTGEKPLPMPGTTTADEIRGEALFAPPVGKPVDGLIHSDFNKFCEEHGISSIQLNHILRGYYAGQGWAQLTAAERMDIADRLQMAGAWRATDRPDAGLKAALAVIFDRKLEEASIFALNDEQIGFLKRAYKAMTVDAFASWLAEGAVAERKALSKKDLHGGTLGGVQESDAEANQRIIDKGLPF